MKLGNLKKLTSRKFRNSWFKRFIEVLEFGPDPKIDRSIELKRKNLKTLIWLDDLRDPADKRMDWLAFSPIGKKVEVIWLKNHYQFKTGSLNMACQMLSVLIMTLERIPPRDMIVPSGW